jgi:F5/8 type C domain.
MKKVISLFLVLALIALSSMSFFACGDTGTDTSDTTSATGSDTTAADTTAAETTVEETTVEETTAASADKDLQSLVDLTSVNGTAGAGDTEGAVNIFDGDSATKWCALQDTTSVEWKMTEAVTVNYYYFTTANDSPERNPSSWVLSGSADGTTWTELSKVEGATLPTDFFTDSDKYTVDAPQSFQYYKLEVTAIAVPGTNVDQFSEFHFFQSAQ